MVIHLIHLIRYCWMDILRPDMAFAVALPTSAPRAVP
jgi:hypothetical protein